MFQIEAALLDFEGTINVDTGKTSVVKGCVTFNLDTIHIKLVWQIVLWQDETEDYCGR